MLLDPMLDIFSTEEQGEIKGYIANLYKDIFPEQSITNHFYNYVGSISHEMPLALLRQFLAPPSSLLDIGSGFGTFATLAINAGYHCTAIEPSVFEVEMARRRLRRLQPSLNADNIFLHGEVRDLAANCETFDAITLWNVLEHIPNTYEALCICAKLLKSRGYIFIICLNYFTFRDEAHYQIPWSPFCFFYKKKFINKIRAMSRDQSYFHNCTVPVTNWGIIFYLWKIGFTIYDFSGIRISLRASKTFSVILKRLKLLSPFVHSVCLVAQKDA